MRLHYEWKCPYCPAILESRRKFQRHVHDNHAVNGTHEYTCKYCGTVIKTTHRGIVNHELRCNHNPGKIQCKQGSRAFTQTPEFRAQCSERMKNRHKLGIAPTFQSRTKVKHSYPEMWVIGLLYNKYGWTENIEYKTELPFHQYFLDFAWPDKRLCIEIDGELHRYEDRQKTDAKKDALLCSEGWRVLRVKWGYILKNKDAFVKMVEQFLTGCGDITVPLYKTHKERLEEAKQLRHKQGVEQNCLGWDCVQKITTSEWNDRKQRIIDSNVDMTKPGWIKCVSKKTGLSRRQIYKVVEHFSDLKTVVYRRAPNGTGVQRIHNPKYEHGRICEAEYNRRLKVILSTGVDFNLRGWRKFLVAHTGFSRTVIIDTLEHFAPRFNYRKCTKHLVVGELVDPPA